MTAMTPLKMRAGSPPQITMKASSCSETIPGVGLATGPVSSSLSCRPGAVVVADAAVGVIAVMRHALLTSRQRVVPGLAQAEALKQELLNFQVKVTEEAHKTFGS
jgi:hypothetical protein